nr:hypothetical protein [uncultured Marinobacter sp.]
MIKIFIATVVGVMYVRIPLFTVITGENDLMTIIYLGAKGCEVGWLHHYDEIIVPEPELLDVHRSVGGQCQPVNSRKFFCPWVSRKTVFAVQAAGCGFSAKASSIHLRQRTAANVPVTDENQALGTLWQPFGKPPVSSNLRQQRMA